VNRHGRTILTCVSWLEYCCPLLVHIVFWVNRTPAAFYPGCPYFW
jgi:hypothetical protein